MGRVWIYIIGRSLNNAELATLLEDGRNFVKSWTAHENKLSGSFEIFKERLVMVKVDENVYEASGCSIDKLTRFIREEEKKLNLELMNRLLVALKKEEKVEILHSSKIKELLEKGEIHSDTIVFNTSASNSNELENWEVPLKETWLKKYLPITTR